MIYKFLRFFLFLLDPETVHNLVIFLLRCPPVQWILKQLYFFEDPRLERHLMGLRFPNPIGLAAGFDKNGKALIGLQALGFGFIEVGTVTPKPQLGNPKPRILRFQKEKALVNWMGFNNDGVDRVVENIRKQKPKLNIPIGLNIGKNKDTPLEKGVDDYLYCLEKAYPYVDFFVINISSPNTPQLRELQEGKHLMTLLSRLKEASDRLFEIHKYKRPLLIKIAPDISPEVSMTLIEQIQKFYFSGVVISNTTTDYSLLPQYQGNQGGISGLPLQQKANALLEGAKKKNPSLKLVGVGGIFSVEDAKKKFQLGADFIEFYTGLIFLGPGLIAKIKSYIIQESDRG